MIVTTLPLVSLLASPRSNGEDRKTGAVPACKISQQQKQLKETLQRNKYLCKVEFLELEVKLGVRLLHDRAELHLARTTENDTVAYRNTVPSNHRDQTQRGQTSFRTFQRSRQLSLVAENRNW